MRKVLALFMALVMLLSAVQIALAKEEVAYTGTVAGGSLHMRKEPSPSGKVVFDRLAFMLCGAAVINYMFFGTDLGVISSTLQYEKSVSFSLSSQLLNIVILILVIAILYFLACKYPRTVSTMLLTSIIALGGSGRVKSPKSSTR